MTAAADRPVLSIEGLDVTFAIDSGDVHAVKDLTLEVHRGEVLAIVGESGSGKSVTAKSVLGLLPDTAVTRGAVVLQGRDVLTASKSQLRGLRGADVSMVFQEPSTALNPVFTIGWQIAEGLRAHNPKLSKKELRARVVQALEDVGIPHAADRYDYYPHQFSGGQKQRIVIAMALALARTSSSRTSPRPRWMSPCRRRSSICCATCATSAAPRSSSSPTTWASSRTWRIASRSCTAATWWRRRP